MTWQRILGWVLVVIGVGSAVSGVAAVQNQHYQQPAQEGMVSLVVIAICGAIIWVGWLLLKRHPRRTL